MFTLWWTLPTSLTIEELMKPEGESSHWINEAQLVPARLGGGRGMGLFPFPIRRFEVARYIAEQGGTSPESEAFQKN